MRIVKEKKRTDRQHTLLMYVKKNRPANIMAMYVTSVLISFSKSA